MTKIEFIEKVGELGFDPGYYSLDGKIGEISTGVMVVLPESNRWKVFMIEGGLENYFSTKYFDTESDALEHLYEHFKLVRFYIDKRKKDE